MLFDENVKYYDDGREINADIEKQINEAIVKMEEISNNETRIYEINPETNDIKCITA